MAVKSYRNGAYEDMAVRVFKDGAWRDCGGGKTEFIEGGAAVPAGIKRAMVVFVSSTDNTNQMASVSGTIVNSKQEFSLGYIVAPEYFATYTKIFLLELNGNAGNIDVSVTGGAGVCRNMYKIFFLKE